MPAFRVLPEVTAKLSRMGEKIAEVPISYNPRSKVEGKKIRHSDGWLAIWTLIRYRFVPRRRWLRGEASQAPFAVSFLSHALALNYRRSLSRLKCAALRDDHLDLATSFRAASAPSPNLL